uniref:NAD dependent epimerase/dehydratase family protein n=1 Tax=Candidatus Kentrum sp. FW TaxID=2126338 RepID=A0A450TJX2_9GAMM|nr:MAG: NAD dependent epimerase/dehydratase family protein [Candidatus Kentron sp. FW]
MLSVPPCQQQPTWIRLPIPRAIWLGRCAYSRRCMRLGYQKWFISRRAALFTVMWIQFPYPKTTHAIPYRLTVIVKVAIENYIAMFSSLHGFSPLVLRLSNPYGPRQGHIGVQGVIPTFFRQIIDGQPIKILGDGYTIRDYIYISDAVSFVEGAIQKNLSGIYNAGSGTGTSIKEVVELISEITGINRMLNTCHTEPSMSKASSLISTRRIRLWDGRQ